MKKIILVSALLFAFLLQLKAQGTFEVKYIPQLVRIPFNNIKAIKNLMLEQKFVYKESKSNASQYVFEGSTESCVITVNGEDYRAFSEITYSKLKDGRFKVIYFTPCIDEHRTALQSVTNNPLWKYERFLTERNTVISRLYNYNSGLGLMIDDRVYDAKRSADTYSMQFLGYFAEAEPVNKWGMYHIFENCANKASVDSLFKSMLYDLVETNLTGNISKAVYQSVFPVKVEKHFFQNTYTVSYDKALNMLAIDYRTISKENTPDTIDTDLKTFWGFGDKQPIGDSANVKLYKYPYININRPGTMTYYGAEVYKLTAKIDSLKGYYDTEYRFRLKLSDGKLPHMDAALFNKVKIKYPLLAQLETYDATTRGTIQKAFAENIDNVLQLRYSSGIPTSLIEYFMYDLSRVYKYRALLGPDSVALQPGMKTYPADIMQEVLLKFKDKPLNKPELSLYRGWTHQQFLKTLSATKLMQLQKEIEAYVQEYGNISDILPKATVPR